MMSKESVTSEMFNLNYISTDVNGDAKRFSYSLYPSIQGHYSSNFLSTKVCIKNFNDNLLGGNPRYDKYSDILDKPITMDDLLNNPQDVSYIIGQLVKLMGGTGISLDELTDNLYP